MKSLVFLLAISPIIANFLDYFLGKEGDRAIRSRLLSFYIAIDGDWRNIYRVSASFVDRFMSERLRAFKPFFFLTIIFYSSVISLMIFVYHLYYIGDVVDYISWLQVHEERSIYQYVLRDVMMPNVIAEIVSWTSSLLVVRRLKIASVAEAIALTIVLFVIAAFTFSLVIALQQSVNLTSLVEWYVYSFEAGDFFELERSLVNALSELGFPVAEYTYNFHGPVPLAVLLPLFYVILTTLVGLVLLTFRPLLRAPLGTLLARLDGSDKNVLTSISLGLAAISALIVAYSNWSRA